MIIQFVRHMETEMNQKGILQGSIDSSLSGKGIKESFKFSEENSFSDIDAIYCSNLERAKVLARLIGMKIDKEIVIDERLNEIMLGEWQGLTWSEIEVQYEDFLKEWYKDTVNIPSPGGESYLDLKNRVDEFLKELKEKDYKKVIIITHGALIKTAVCSMLEIDLENRSKLEIDNGSITEIYVNKFKVKLLKLNSKR